MNAFVSIIFGLLGLISTFFIYINGYYINRDIDTWKIRAQVSSKPNDMYNWMTNVKEGMELWNMTQGHAALLFPTPENDMSLIYHTVKQHVDQAYVLTTTDRSSPEYQTGLDNLRGSIRELNLMTFEYWSIHSGLVWWFVCIMGWFIFIVFGLLRLTE